MIYKNKLIRQPLYFHTKAVDEILYRIRGIFSTGEADRQGEVVNQNGWKLEEFMRNPVVLFGHDHWQPAVGKVIEIAVNADGKLEGEIEFAAKEYDFAMTLFKLYAGGFMRAFSVGFMNDKYTIDQENDIVMLTENTLYEVSCVNVPANAMALAYSKGIDTEPVERFMRERKKRKEKSPACRIESETEDECVNRKIPELIDEGMDQDQAETAARNICATACESKGAGKGDIHQKPEPEIEGEYIIIRVKDPDYFDPDSFRTITISEDKGIKATTGCKQGEYEGGTCNIGVEIQRYLFDKEKWTEADAQAWVDENKEAKQVLSRSNVDTLRAAMRTIADVLEAHKGQKPPSGRVSATVLSAAIRQLLKARKTVQRQ